MKRLRLSAPWSLTIVVASLSGTIAAEPSATGDAPPGESVPSDGWGDPYEEDVTDRGWSWFGMGYERRAQPPGAAMDIGGTRATAQPRAQNSRRR